MLRQFRRQPLDHRNRVTVFEFGVSPVQYGVQPLLEPHLPGLLNPRAGQPRHRLAPPQVKRLAQQNSPVGAGAVGRTGQRDEVPEPVQVDAPRPHVEEVTPAPAFH